MALPYLPMLNCCKIGVGLKKKRISSESVSDRDRELMDGKVEVFDDNVGVGEIKSRDIVCQNGVFLLNGHRNDNVNGNGIAGRQKAKKIWRRHVWIVLMLDLAVCLIFLGFGCLFVAGLNAFKIRTKFTSLDLVVVVYFPFRRRPP